MGAPRDQPQKGVEQKDFPGVFVFADGHVGEKGPQARVDRSQGVPPDGVSERFVAGLPETENENDGDADRGWDRQRADDR